MNSVKLALNDCQLYDIIMSEEKIRGEKSIRPNQPLLLFLYLGVVTWTVAQVVYAKTGKGSAVLEWEPIPLFGFLIVGIPWVLYLILREIKTKLMEMENKLMEMETKKIDFVNNVVINK
ncbi:hypothetical protein [Bacillus sp. UNC41MFS5]|uniref:hypothetical protein n=1 Tax=Bacillus sp. UNC41MFS5 TaxID=1449046 RepID=UPI001E55D736|nr:hypothetical protein [Bacillus sp. UNC41MFS5]